MQCIILTPHFPRSIQGRRQVSWEGLRTLFLRWKRVVVMAFSLSSSGIIVLELGEILSIFYHENDCIESQLQQRGDTIDIIHNEHGILTEVPKYKYLWHERDNLHCNPMYRCVTMRVDATATMYYDYCLHQRHDAEASALQVHETAEGEAENNDKMCGVWRAR